jgi:hypothetical protein
VKNLLRILFVALLIGIVGYLMQVPDLEERYATAGEANFGASMKSWVRDWMPPAARNITAATDMDNNKFILRFEMPEATPVKLPGTCAEVSAGAAPRPQHTRDWWPKDVPAQDGAKPRHVYYRCDRQFVALSATEAYVWLP